QRDRRRRRGVSRRCFFDGDGDDRASNRQSHLGSAGLRAHRARGGGVDLARSPRRTCCFRIANERDTMIKMRVFLPFITSRLRSAGFVVAAALTTAAIASCGVDQSGLGSMPFLPHDAASDVGGAAGVTGTPGAAGSPGTAGTGGTAGSVI